MTKVHQIHSELKFKDDTILLPSRWLKFTGSILNQISRMIQSCHLLDDWSSPDPLWTKVQGWYNPTTFSMTKVHRIHSEPEFKDDTILPHYRPKFTWSLLDICLGMIQSLLILEDQGLWINLGQVPKDDTIPLHSWWPRSPDYFWTYVPGWYNPSSFSNT